MITRKKFMGSVFRLLVLLTTKDRKRDRAHHRPAELSGGQRQRFAIARALATHPSLVWADEPTGALDSQTSQEILDLMLRLNREEGLTFVWVTHAPEIAQQAGRLITMRDGLVETVRLRRYATNRRHPWCTRNLSNREEGFVSLLSDKRCLCSVKSEKGKKYGTSGQEYRKHTE